MSLSLIDILFLVTVALLAFNGFSNGAVTSLVNLISIPFGFAVAYLFGPRFTLLLAANGLPATPLISYIVLFCGTVLLLHIVGTVLRGVISKVPLVGLGDRLLGTVIGFVEAWLLWVVLLLILHNFLQNIQNIPGTIDTSQFQSWQQFYKDAVSQSLFASVNSFIVTGISVH
ncbi:MAG: CvpA family protein [Ktedonobacteraceae bacterium]